MSRLHGGAQIRAQRAESLVPLTASTNGRSAAAYGPWVASANNCSLCEG